MRSTQRIALICSVLLAGSQTVQAESNLASFFAQAWQRQPALAGLSERQRAAELNLAAASAWTAQPPSIELATRSDQFNTNRGAREHEFGVAFPLWLPGERGYSRSLAVAEREALGYQVDALRLKLAQVVREGWWAWQIALNEQGLAEGRLAAARRLRDDVARRHAAGDLSRADLNQADGALAQAVASHAEAQAAETMARYRLEALSGQPLDTARVMPEPEPEPAARPDEHPILRELAARSLVAQRSLDLARVQGRANPELAISTRSDQAGQGAAAEQTWALAVRIPLSAGPRQDARVATANAVAIEAGLERTREQERLSREADVWRTQLASARTQLTAAEQRARVATENRTFYDKSFRLGESDLPTRLRIENEAFEADRALGKARIGLAMSISFLRQSLGLLPE